jgi:signal transduction histidine kinase
MESSVLFIGLVVLGLEFFLVFRPSISQLEVAIAALLQQEEQLLAANQSLTTAERDLLQAQRAGRVATFRWDAVADHWTGSDLLVELLGLDPDGPRTFQAWTERLAPSRQAEFQDRFREFLASGTLLDLDYPVLDPATGTERWLHVQGQLERDAQRRPLRLSGTVQDITERRRAEAENRQTQAQLHQNQRLESLGSLAGGVAHDMNNVLAAVQAITEALRQSRPGDADLLRSLDALDAASVRGRGLVRGLTQFVRKELKETEILDLNRLVRDEADLLRRTTRQKVALVLDLETGLAPVLGERSTLATALMNICVNAVDAMPGGGILTLRTRSGEAGTVELEVSDTGEGMSPEVAERAMEPFFTTKPRGKGTGLGLATVHAAAVNHGGQAWLRSEPGKGTSVFLRFPACAGRPAPAPAPTEPLRAGRPLELLLVDDDFLVRDSLAALLTSLGHRVREAPGGAEALGALASGPPPDLVILDYNMPDMDGLETLRRLRRTLPRLPVLLATGFMEPAVQRVLDADPHASGISKPFTARELVRRMGGMLGA